MPCSSDLEPPLVRQEIATALAAHGLVLHGGFDRAADEDLPLELSGAPARSVMLVGNAGAGYWRHFSRWRASQPADLENPLDTWSRAVIGSVAERFAARVVMPNDRPYAPFQQWAMRASGLRPSPLGLLIHPEYGLWHAFRGALLFDRPLGWAPVEALPHPCGRCRQKPCLTACPVGAFGERIYAIRPYSPVVPRAVQALVGHLREVLAGGFPP